jgi:hypothetical protein
MAQNFSEEQVHQHIWATGISNLIAETDAFNDPLASGVECDEYGEPCFELWRLIKHKALEKLRALHNLMAEGKIIGSKVKLPTDVTRPMELDFLGHHEDGIFILELKVDRSAERNAFSELLGYSYYISEMFALSGPKDITNVLVTPLFAKMSRHAFLYDLLITERNIILYRPTYKTEEIGSLQLELYIPTDEDFRHFSNELLSHEAMTCVVASFHDIEGWIDSNEENGSLNSYTVEHLEAVSSYCAQLMESERLHGFCWARKRWSEIPVFYENSLIICALNPFGIINPARSEALSGQIAPEELTPLREIAERGFRGRLLSLAKKALNETITNEPRIELEMPEWSAMITEMVETVFTHNVGFRPTGMLREAYVANVNSLFDYEARGGTYADNSVLKVNDTFNWFKAWSFMEGCGFGLMNSPEDSGDGEDYNDIVE